MGEEPKAKSATIAPRKFGEPSEEELERRRVEASEADFERPDWTLMQTLSWIAFRDRLQINAFRNRSDLREATWYDAKPSKGLRDQNFLGTLRTANIEGRLAAIRNPERLPREHWFGLDILSAGDVWFLKAEVLALWPEFADEVDWRVASVAPPRSDTPGEPIETDALLEPTRVGDYDSTRESHQTQAISVAPAGKRKRGPKTNKRESIAVEMKAHVQAGFKLEKALEKELEAKYGASRDTCRKARQIAMSTLK